MSPLFRVALSLLCLGLSLISGSAVAVPPPYAPLPPCKDENGERTGACPQESDWLRGSAVGRFGPNVTLDAYIDPEIPVCDSWDHNSGDASPDPCYSAVTGVEVVGCAYLNVLTDKFQEGDCGRALYENPPGNTEELFSVSGGPGFTCGGGGNFRTFVWGGPYTQKDKIWGYLGPRALRCAVTFNGDKPDGLYGPTWVKLRVGMTLTRSGHLSTCCSQEKAEFYVPIDGDIRDFGPVAGFEIVSSEAGLVEFKNTSFHTSKDSLTYRWDFGDGETSTSKDPTHQYKEPGVYKVRLTAKDSDGDEDTTNTTVEVKFGLIVKLEASPKNPKIGDDVKVTLRVYNPFDEDVEHFELIGGALGLRTMPDFLAQTSGPDPKVPSSLGAKETVTFEFVLTPLRSGRSIIEGGAQAWFGDLNVSATDEVVLQVPARLAVSLSTSIRAQTKVGDEFDVTATLRNDDETDIENIGSEPLELVPADLVSIVSGPTSADGKDLRASKLSLAPGETTTISWRYKAEQKGKAKLRALINGRDPWTDELFMVSASKSIAVDYPAIEITEWRLQPQSPIPGGFGTIRGKITNIGSLKLEDIDFEVESHPELKVVAGQLERLADNVSPRIASLAPGASRDFLIPVGMVTEPGEFSTFEVTLEFAGKAEVDGEEIEITDSDRVTGALDMSYHWTTAAPRVWDQLMSGGLEFFEGVNEWGDESTLGGIAVGGASGVISAFQKLGDGILSIDDVLIDVASDGGARLTKQGKAVVQAAVEYWHANSLKEMRDDAAAAGLNLSMEACETLGQWLYAIDKAQAKGDVREVSRLITEPGTEFALGIVTEGGVEQVASKVAGKLFKRAVELPEKRTTPTTLKRESKPGDRSPQKVYAEDGDDLRDMPTGVPVTGRTVAKTGISIDEHAWMVQMAKEHGVAFFVRPRPADAAKFVDRGYNPKPMAIKTKSVNDLDVQWLGYDDYADQKGLVVLREPKDPFPKMLEAMNKGEELTKEQVNKILERYADRLAEYVARKDLLKKLNADGGFEIQRLGKTIKTQVTLDEDGLMRFTHNNAPVFSDVDLLHIAKPDGSPISPELHRKITEAGGWGIDSQHGDTMSTSDFPNWKVASETAEKYGKEHMRGGEPLLIVQGDATTLGYVESMDIPQSVPNPNGSDYALFGQITVTYEGAGIK